MALRAAIAGAGLMGRWHADAVARTGGRVAVVLDRDAGAAARLARTLEGARPARVLGEVLAAGGIDVLHVCTPLESHAELVEAALRRGVSVLVEKPMAATAAETERLYRVAAEHGASLCPVHQFPFQRGVARARAQAPRLGRLRHLDARFCSAGGAGRSGAALDAIVADVLPHPLSLIETFVPGAIGARPDAWIAMRPAPGELRATLTTRDACFSILVSLSSRPTTATLELLGSDATIRLNLFHGFSTLDPGAVSRVKKAMHPFERSSRTLVAAGANLARRAVSAEPAYPGLRALVEAFHASVGRGSAPPIAPDEVIAIAAVRDALGPAGHPAATH
jgi:predicted dehydrogenase